MSVAAMRGETCKSISPSRKMTVGRAAVADLGILFIQKRIVNASPSEGIDNVFDVRKIFEEKIGLAGLQAFARPTSGPDCDCPRAKCFAARYVVASVTDDIDLSRIKVVPVLFLGALPGERAELIAIVMIVRESAEFEEFPQTVTG